MANSKKFDILKHKIRLDEEKAKRNEGKGETTGEKIVKMAVTLVAVFMLWSVSTTVSMSQTTRYIVYLFLITGVLARAYSVFKPRA
jgi:hypothetical protein